MPKSQFFPALRAKYDNLCASGVSDLDIMKAMQDEMSKVKEEKMATRTIGGRTRNRNKNVFRPGIRMSALRQSSKVLDITAEPKDEATVTALRNALHSTLFSMEEARAVNTVIDAMQERELKKGTDIIVQGKQDHDFSVLVEGSGSWPTMVLSGTLSSIWTRLTRTTLSMLPQRPWCNS